MNTEVSRPLLPMSHRLARGLRRDLFRDLSDKLLERWTPLARSLATVQLPYRGHRELRRAWERTITHMQRTTFSFREQLQPHVHATGVCLIPATRTHDDGGDEPVLEAFDLSLELVGARVHRGGTQLGSISHHLVERLFERLNTTSPGDVIRELDVLAFWMRLMHVATALAAPRYTLHQVVLPSAEGAALCVRDATTGAIHARTWVGAGTSPRIDATLRALKAWKATRARDVDSLKAMLRQPENMWMQEPYAG